VDARYWAYGPDGYFWVPGTWVEPPDVGLLWTPGYWGWGGDAYAWNDGLLGPHRRLFYGGVNYGYGYVVPATKADTGETTSSATTDP